jgi:sugar phosphate permease
MTKIFYGWWVLAGVFLVYFASNGILINTLPLFYPELIREFGWNEEQVTRPAAILFVISAILSPLFGALMDRYSARVIMFLSVSAAVAALAAYPFVTSLGQLVVIYVLFAFGLSGGGLVPTMLILTRWFARYRGVAVGIVLMASSLGGALFPLMARETLVQSGWREAIALITIIGGILMIAPVILLIRNYPRNKGLAPDGGGASSTAKQKPMPVAYEGTLVDAMRTPMFYLVAFATGTLWFCIVGTLQHQSIFLGQDIGLDRATLPVVFSVFFWAAIVGKLSFGWLSDFFPKANIMLVAILTLTVGLGVLYTVDAHDTTPVYAYALIYGVGYSGAFTMVQLMIAEVYAGPSYGKILGTFAFVDTMAGGLGTRVLGDIRVNTDSYLPAFILMIGLCIAAAVCIVFIGRMTRQTETAPAHA